MKNGLTRLVFAAGAGPYMRLTGLKGCILGTLLVTASLANAQTAPTSKAIDLVDARLFPESIAISQAGTAYVGSMYGGIRRVSLKTRKVEAWIKPAAGGTASIFGVLADVRNGMLWACSNNFAAMGLLVPGAAPGHVLAGFDLRTGAHRVNLPLPGKNPVCNDIAVTPDGMVFVTDTAAPQILRWRPGATALEIWVTDPALGSGIDGIAMGADGNVYVNNYHTGDLYRIVRLAGGKAGPVVKLALSRPLAMPDGMRSTGGMTFALVEGAGRIDKVSIAGDHARIETMAEGIVGPTGIDTLGKTAWYVQGQLDLLTDPAKHGVAPEPFKLTPIDIVK